MTTSPAAHRASPHAPHHQLVLLAALLAGCGDTSTIPIRVASIVVQPPQATVAVGSSVQLTAELFDRAGNPLSGRQVTWTSSQAQFASVSPGGLVTGLAVGGPVTILATSEGAVGPAEITIIPPPVASVTVTPPNSTVILGGSVQLTATLRDGSGNLLTDRSVSWSSSNSGLAAVSPSGLVTALGVGGPVTITAVSEGVSGSAQATVVPPPVASVAVEPSSATIAVGGSIQLSATPRDSSGNALTGRAITWSSANSGVASVSATGLVTGLAAGGPLAITATSEGVSGTATITVADDPCSRSTSIAVGQSVTGTLQAGDCQLSDGSYVDRWQLDLSADTVLEINMTSTAFDTYLIITDANLNVLAQDDDGGTGTNSRVTGSFPAGTYFIWANSFAAGQTGSYQLSVQQSSSTCMLHTITVGQTVTGTLQAGDCQFADDSYVDVYQLTLASQSALQIDMTSSEFDTFLIVSDSSGNVVAFNDDGGQGTNSRIARSFAAGDYFVFANSFAAGQTGTYQLSVLLQGSAAPVVAGRPGTAAQPRTVPIMRGKTKALGHDLLGLLRSVPLKPLTVTANGAQ